MKSLLVIPLLALSMSASAAPEISVGVAGGATITDELEVLGSGLFLTPRFGIGFDDNLGLELDVGYTSGVTRIGEHPYTALTPRLNLIGKLWNTGKRQPDGSYADPPPIHPILAVGLGAWYKNTDDGGALGDEYTPKDVDFLANAGPGLMVPIGPLHLRTDLRWVLSLGNENFRNRGDQFINWEWSAGLGFTFGGKADKDKDGILDEVDECRDEMEDFDEYKDEDGCPDPDNDGDGIADVDEECDNEAEDDDDFEDEDGCPDPDNDGDEILDEEDECPNEAGNASGKGCPDQDEDTVVDADDECVDEAGSVDAFGCPDEDEDRVPNYRDECPEVAGPAKADPMRSNGCMLRVFVTKQSITITDKIFFDTNKATIKKESNELLDEIVATLNKFDHIKKVSIEGHTDNTGDPEYNKTLSEERAAAVVAYLVEKEIDEGRLESKGFGQDKPLVDGEEADTDEGREKNRRVEFNITEQDETEVKLKRPKLEFGKAAEDALDVEGLVAKENPVPATGFVAKDATCKAKIVIEKDGTVSKVKVKDCVGMPRLATEKTLAKWTFEPYEKDGEAIRVSTVFELVFEGGAAKITHKAKNLKPIEE